MLQQICNNCVLYDTVAGITFDENGICNFCENYKKNIIVNFDSEPSKANKLLMMKNELKTYRKKKKNNNV